MLNKQNYKPEGFKTILLQDTLIDSFDLNKKLLFVFSKETIVTDRRLIILKRDLFADGAFLSGIQCFVPDFEDNG